MEFTKPTEPSTQYHLWTGLAMLSAAVKRRMYVDMGFFTLYPNIYVMLIGPAAAKKSTACRIGLAIAEKAGIHRFSDRITGAALAKELAAAMESEQVGAEVYMTSARLICAPELGVFIGPQSYKDGTISDLTDLFDCPDFWEKKTKGQGTDTVLGPYITLLGGAIPKDLQAIIPSDQSTQGFTSRIIFVYAEGRRQRVAMPTWSTPQEKMQNDLINDLAIISSLRGPMKLDPLAFAAYENFYYQRPDPSEEFQDERLHGYASRKDIHVLKLATLFSLARGNDLIIIEDDFNAAVDSLTLVDKNLHKVFELQGFVGGANANRIHKQILNECMKKGEAEHSTLLKRNWYHMSADDFDRAIKALTDTGEIETAVVQGRGGRLKTVYRLTGGQKNA